MAALLKRFGNFAKFKNQMLLSEAAASYHLRLIMVSVQYDTGMTFAELFTDPETQKRLNEYRDHPPASTVPGGRWCRQVETALKWIHASELADEKVILMCEVQCVLRKYRDVRLNMHEVYKVHRANDPNSLHNDFKKIRVDRDREKQWVKDGITPGLRYCRENNAEGLRLMIEAHELNELNQCLEVAGRYGSLEALQELLTVKGVTEVVAKNSRALFKAIID